MTRLVLVQGQNKRQTERSATPGPHRNADTEGEAAKILLESQGYKAKSRVAHGQYEFACPFHEQELINAPFPRGHSTNFYVDRNTSKYFCQSASCGEKGNLATLERHFGIANDPTAANRYRTNEDRLREWEAQLPRGPRRQVFYDKGLRDDTIERFRFGYDQEKARYVLPYLEGRRPLLFRFYDPDFEKKHEQWQKHKENDDERKPLKYWWEKGSESILFNAGDAVGDSEGRVFICEGEQKAAMMCQLGYAAVAVPGANIWKDEWFAQFNHCREVFILFDNDNPDFHHYGPCNKCGTKTKEECAGHNPGQDNALKLLDKFGWRARNVVLPLEPDENGMLPKKTDINEFFMRDGKNANDLLDVIFGENEKHSPFLVRTLGEIREEPPAETVFLIDNLLPRGGRLLVSGAPKVGKSIYVENMALSIASGLPFLGNFTIAPSPNGQNDGHRVLLLDRELSERSLYDRLNSLIEHKPGYKLADDKLLIDHRIQVRLDEPGAASALINLIRVNNADVIILDTAYKFFAGDLESSKSVKTALATLDTAIGETGCTVVLTHHHRKGQQNKGKEEAPHPDQVVGSFLWTGWPNGTVLLNFLNRRVESPFNTVCSFVAFRDCAPPDPLALYRGRESIAYTSVVPHSFESDEDIKGSANMSGRPFSYNEIANALLEYAPITEENFIEAAKRIFNVSAERIRFQLLDIADRHPDFVREGNGSRDKPYIWKYKHEVEEEPYEEPELELG